MPFYKPTQKLMESLGFVGGPYVWRKDDAVLRVVYYVRLDNYHGFTLEKDPGTCGIGFAVRSEAEFVALLQQAEFIRRPSQKESYLPTDEKMTGLGFQLKPNPNGYKHWWCVDSDYYYELWITGDKLRLDRFDRVAQDLAFAGGYWVDGLKEPQVATEAEFDHLLHFMNWSHLG